MIRFLDAASRSTIICSISEQQRLLSRIEKELKSGRQTPVELVDTEYITKLFRKDIDKLSKEVSKIGKVLYLKVI